MDTPKPRITNHKAHRLFKMMREIRFLDWEIPAQVIATFFYVASQEKCHKTAIEKALNFSSASGSRNTDWLSKDHRLGKSGLGLIIKEADKEDGRKVVLKLSPKGEAFIEKLTSILYDET